MKNQFLNFLTIILKKIAQLTIKKYKPLIIGITGNVGKTSTKELIALFLKQEKRIWSSSKSFNNEFGLPLAILGDFKEIESKLFWVKVLLKGIKQLIFYNRNYPEILVLEYGIDRPNDMNYLLKIARPNIGVFTQSGEIPVHIEFFQNKENIFKEEAKLILNLPSSGLAILNADNDEIFNLKNQTKANVITYGFSQRADVRILNFKNQNLNDDFYISFKINYQGKLIPFKINNVLGENVAYNVASALAVGFYLNVNVLKINEVLKTYQNPPGRFKILKGLNESIVIDDTYNASPLAVLTALNNLKCIKNKKIVVVLGDMLELGKYSYEAHKMIAEKLKNLADVLILLGVRTKIIYEIFLREGLLKNNLFYYEPPLNYQEISELVKKNLAKNTVVLLKGSQGLRLEKIVKEIIIDKDKAKDLLVRQNEAWLKKKGIYEK